MARQPSRADKVSYTANLARHRVTEAQWDRLFDILGPDIDQRARLRIQIISTLYIMQISRASLSVPIKLLAKQLSHINTQCKKLLAELGEPSGAQEPSTFDKSLDDPFVLLIHHLRQLNRACEEVLVFLKKPDTAVSRKSLWKYWIRRLADEFEAAGLPVHASKHHEDRPSTFVKFVLALECTLPQSYRVYERTSLGLASAIQKIFRSPAEDIDIDRFLHPIVTQVLCDSRVDRWLSRAKMDSSALENGPLKADQN